MAWDGMGWSVVGLVRLGWTCYGMAGGKGGVAHSYYAPGVLAGRNRSRGHTNGTAVPIVCVALVAFSAGLICKHRQTER